MKPTTNGVATPIVMSGKELARRIRNLSKRRRAKLVADIIDGRIQVIDLTVKQWSLIAGVSLPYIAEARNGGPNMVTRLMRDWRTANADQKVEWARAADPELVFDVVARAGD